ncbi:MAG TPA: galactose-1-phosphate uridylyltransferase [Atribacteraceae bacterium]|nr:galactose-1-phosphate uridylyltransferase [Atribacteraceae bacterium]
MSQLRKDPVVGRWVIVATDRSPKPYDFATSVELRKPGPCAFCETMESYTPREIWSARSPQTLPNNPGWQVRVVPNKFPALRLEEWTPFTVDNGYENMGGFGAHEVIIETPAHDLELVDLPIDHFQKVFLAYRERMRDLENDQRIQYCLIFKNQGALAGASIQHAHSQLIAVPVVPKRVKEELFGSRDYYGNKGTCIFCDTINRELSILERVVYQNERFIATVPYAPRFPFEIWVLPLEHAAHFSQTDERDLAALSEVMQNTLRAVKNTLDDPPFNMLLHVAPYSRNGENPDELSYHWHIEILPSLTKVAGFEWGTGFYINPVIPEEAALLLRDSLKTE